ncbi:hypothetical protein STCU_09200 [Strigomonas culicis]|uniref:EF-hand domain-containing protein n=1 Tax=Strigomonas culicis TaxID=28005 RepID=S9VAF9_9TRYP|nr:hypothetical protein STCU_09200 [Strigomonas culicis]|eukprot:EPY20005.1 hypothetical protein STCU_09200 [Strigomonas culicis]
MMNTALITANHFQAIVDKSKRLLLRGPSSINGLRSISRALGVSNDAGGLQVAEGVFCSALAENGVNLTPAEVKIVFKHLDRHGSNTIDPTDFLAALRYDMTAIRRAWLQRAWHSFHKGANGSVEVEYLQQHYRADRHPDVVKGERSAEDVYNEFAATFNEATNPDGVVSPQEYEQYYAGVSASYYEDEGFVAMLRGVWEMPGVCEAFSTTLALGQTAQRTFRTNQNLREKDAVTSAKKNETALRSLLLDRHRPVVLASTLAIRRLSAALRSADLAETTFLSQGDFLNALRQSRVYIENTDLLSVLDTNGDGTVDYLLYLELLVPHLPAARAMMVERVWYSVFPAKDVHGRVDVLEFQRRFKAKDGSEKSDFLSGWDARSAPRGKVTVEEVLEWYLPQSEKVQLDKDFEQLLVRQWPGFGGAA